ncbi:MAG: hypothetical protein WCF24_08690 [Acidimicrobiales bacterium]
MEPGSGIREIETEKAHPTDASSVVSPELGAPTAIERALRLTGWIRSHRIALGVGVFFAYAVVGLIANLPTYPWDPNRIATCACGGGKDPAQTVWFLAWTPFALLHGRNFYVTTWLNYPVGVNLAQNTIMPMLGLLTTPITLASNAIASENVLRWLAFPLSASSMYYVVARVSRHRPAAFVAGAFYGFSPFMIGQSSTHLNLGFEPLLPLIFLCIYEIAARASFSVVVWGVLLGLFATAEFYVSPEVLLTTALSGAIALVVLALFHPRQSLRHIPYTLLGLAIGVAIAYACCFNAVRVMEHGALHYIGPPYPPGARYDANLLGPISPTSWQLLTPASLADFGSKLVGGSTNVDENGSYLGIPLLLLLGYFLIRYRRSRWLQFSTLLAVLNFVLSLGQKLHVGSTIYDVHLPFSWLTRWPIMRDAVPARISVLVTFFVACALAAGITARHEARTTSASGAVMVDGQARWAGRKVALIAGWALAALVILSLLPNWPYSSQRALASDALSASSLSVISKGSAVLTYPYAEPGTDDAMVWQAVDKMRFKLVGSYALRRGLDLRSTPLPTGLQPFGVEGIFVNALAQNPVLIPDVPYLAPATASVTARRVVVEPGSPVNAAASGVVQSVNRVVGSFILANKANNLIQVGFTALTDFRVGTRESSWTTTPTRGEHVVVYGSVGPATIGKRRVAQLRTFLFLNQVNAVVVEMGRPGSRTIAAWVSAAIGPPDRARPGAQIWTSAQVRLREPRYGGFRDGRR